MPRPGNPHHVGTSLIGGHALFTKQYV
jgi:hypothetical protein